MPVFECCSSLFVSVLSLKIKLSGGEDCDPLTGLTLPHICACPKPGHEFPTSYVVDLFMFSDLRCEVAMRFVDIFGIVDHHFFNFFP